MNSLRKTRGASASQISIWIDESEEQTRRIARSCLSVEPRLTETEVKVWQEVQRLLEVRAGVALTLPEWFGKVADWVFVGDIRVRRYFPAFVEACKVISLIRSFRRQGGVQKVQSLSVEFADFAIAAILFERVFVESLHRSADRNLETRQTVESIWRRTSKAVGAAALAKELAVSKDRAYARLRRAHEAGSM